MDSEKIINEFKHEIDTFVPCCTSDEKHLDIMKAMFDAYRQKEAMLDKICSVMAKMATDANLGNFCAVNLVNSPDNWCRNTCSIGLRPECIKEWLKNIIKANPEN